MLKTFLMTSGAVAAAGGLYAGGAFDRGEVYPLAMEQVRDELAAMPFPREVVFSSGASSATDVDVDTTANTVSWRLSVGGRHAATFRAIMKPVSGGTRVRLDHEVGDVTSQAGELTSTSFMQSYADANFAERVDAQLEGRSHDPAAAAQVFAKDIHDNPEKVRELGESIRKMHAQVGETFKETSESSPAFERELYSPEERERKMDNATRPAVQLRSN